MFKPMITTILGAAAAASLLAACAAPPADGQARQRPSHEESTGSLLRHQGDGQTINKDQIDPNQILNPAATQPHVHG